MAWDWDEKKNQKLKIERGVGFVDLLEEGELIDSLVNVNHQPQQIWVFKLHGYAWSLIVDIRKRRFVTLYPSRKFTRRYLK